MIQLISEGNYNLIETKSHTKILTLDKAKFAWFNVKNIGDILSRTFHNHKIHNILANGKYKLYIVKDEENLVDLPHLELSVGDEWQGYLLTKGLPIRRKSKHRIIPTNEVITKKFNYLHFYDNSFNNLFKLS